MDRITKKEAESLRRKIADMDGYVLTDFLHQLRATETITTTRYYFIKRPIDNPYRLKRFKDSIGHGFITQYSEPNKKTMKKATTRKKAAPKKKPTLKKVCRKVVKTEGVKADGTLKKGYKYLKGGRVVKAKTATATKKKTTGRKTTTKRKAS